MVVGDWDKWWLEQSVSKLQVCLSAEGAKSVSWPWLSPLRGWVSLTMTFLDKFGYTLFSLGMVITVFLSIEEMDSVLSL